MSCSTWRRMLGSTSSEWSKIFNHNLESNRAQALATASASESTFDGKICVILGNESGDLDSVVSALLLSHAISFSPCRSTLKFLDDFKAVLPVANMRRDDLQLRRDIGFVLDSCGIDARAMTFLDEVPLSKWHQDGRLQLVLVDHNELSFRYQYLDADVVAIFDHHRDHLSANPTAKAAACSRMQPRIINSLVASACSLVVNHFLDVHDPGAIKNPTVAFLVLSTLLLDSHGFNAQLLKFSQTDIILRDRCLNILEQAEKDPDLSLLLFTDLHQRRSDTSGFSPVQLLRRDAKSIQGRTSDGASIIITIAVVIGTLESCTAMPHWLEDVKSTADDALLVVIMFASSVGGQFKRQALLVDCGIGPGRLGALSAFLCSQESLRIEEVCHNSRHRLVLILSAVLNIQLPQSCEAFRALQQHNVKASRKAILPLVKQWIEQ